MAGQKILYFDCASGISGDMTLGALLDLGADEGQFLKELKKLHLPGYEIKIEEVQKNGIRARQVHVLTEEEDGHPHGGHHHIHRTYADIRRIITESGLSDEVKDLALRIFERVAQAEAKVHMRPVDEVHFHEVGAVDSIVDIAGCAILITMLAPQHIYASTVRDGHGFVQCQHGLLPVPVPAVSEILTAAGVRMCQSDVEGELVTPTGAAILAELAEQFGAMPEMRLSAVGWGAGMKDLPIPNVLKVYEGYAGEREDAPDGTLAGQDEVVVLESTLDDCSGELLGYAMEQLLKAGALDVSYTPVFMKKNRPAYRLMVLAKPGEEEKLERLIFRHTTTIGIRRRTETRSVLRRETVTVPTPYGALTAKKVVVEGRARFYPEYESAVQTAQQSGKSLWEIYKSYGQDERTV